MDVSIVVPCRDGQETLACALRSALDQTRPPAEIVVVDDGSSDASAAVARGFGEPVRVRSERCGSASAARRLGASLARGEALMFLDADDVLGPSAVEALSAVLESRRGRPAIARCPWRRLEKVGEQWLTRPASCAPRAPDEDDLSAWLTGWYHPPCSLLWSREAYDLSGGWGRSWGVNDDGRLVMRALARGAELVPASAGRAFYRRPAPGGTTLSGTGRTRPGLESRLDALDDVAAVLRREGRLAEHRAALARAYDLVAADAGGHEGLLRRALDGARRGGPRWLREWRRAAGRARARLARPSDAGAVPWADLRSAPSPPAVRRACSPEVSVVVPAYQREAVLPRALASVLSQDFEDFEVLVVDDASTDGTAAVAERCGDPRVRCLRQDVNGGAAAARNRGVEEARGELIAFLDSDDEWLPEKLSLQVGVFRAAGPDLGLVYTGVETVGPGGERTFVAPRHRGDVYRALLEDNVIYGGGSNAMVRRGALARAGPFDEGLQAIEDYDLWLRIAQFHRVDFVDRPLIRYHDSGPQPGGRRSLDLAANLGARERVFERYDREMRRAGVAHLFLLESARRHLRSPDGDAAAGRRLVLRALARRPGAAALYPWLPYMLLPAAGRRRLRGLEAALRRALAPRFARAERRPPRAGAACGGNGART